MTPLVDRYKEITQAINDLFVEENYLKEVFYAELDYLYSVVAAKYGRNSKETHFCETHKPEYNYSVIKEIEKHTKHDISSVVKHIQAFYNSLDGDIRLANYVHVGLTSQDMVSLVYTKLVSQAYKHITTEQLSLSTKVHDFYSSHDRLVGYTHGQKSTPVSTKNLWELYISSVSLEDITPRARFMNGACGDKVSMSLTAFNFELVKYNFMMKYPFKFDISLSRQTDYYVYVVDVLNNIKKLALVCLREAQNFWLYCHNGAFVQKFSSLEVGSSTMPQKINPINFENAEGNCLLAIGLCDTLVNSLSISRMDRDLKDLTMIRNVGLVFGYMSVAIDSMRKGIEKVAINTEAIEKDINNSYELYAEVVNLVIRLNEPDVDAYEICRKAFQGRKNVTKKEFDVIINSMPISEQTKNKIKI